MAQGAAFGATCGPGSDPIRPPRRHRPRRELSAAPTAAAASATTRRMACVAGTSRPSRLRTSCCSSMRASRLPCSYDRSTCSQRTASKRCPSQCFGYGPRARASLLSAGLVPHLPSPLPSPSPHLVALTRALVTLVLTLTLPLCRSNSLLVVVLLIIFGITQARPLPTLVLLPPPSHAPSP